MSIRAIPKRFTTDILLPAQVDAVHTHALEILQRVGITTSNEPLLKMMAEHGQSVDFDQRRIRFDPSFVTDRVALAERRYTLCGRSPQDDLVLDAQQAYLSTDGCPAEIIDLESGSRRYGRKDDLAEIARVADALPQIGFLWQSVSASDTLVEVRPMHETHAQFPNTTKHIQQMTAVDAFNARGLVEMCTVIAGSSEALRERPIMSNFQCSISPLHWDDGPVEAIRIFSEVGIPVGILSMPLAGATAPTSVAGLLSIAVAETLSGIAIQQAMVPGARTFFSSHATTIDMHSGSLGATLTPEDLFLELAVSQLGRYYDLPTNVGTLGTGSKQPDWQAGAENAMSTYARLFSIGDMCSGAGSLFNDSVYSLVDLILDTDIWEVVVRTGEGFPFEEEDFAMHAIESVGPGGHFLGEQHTLDHMRDFWRSEVVDRSTWDEWEASGRPDPRPAAEEKLRTILATHEPEALPDDVAKELDRIMTAYEAEAREGLDED